MCFFEEIEKFELADDVEVRPGQLETMLVGALFVSGGRRDINLQVIGPGGDNLLVRRTKGEDSFEIPIVEVRTCTRSMIAVTGFRFFMLQILSFLNMRFMSVHSLFSCAGRDL